ncbi:MAG: extracellular solute-binding protein [Gammaproteobacteria bacterium]
MRLYRFHQSFSRPHRALAALTAALPLVALLVFGAASPATAAQPTLTLYNGQHQQMVRLLVSAFEKDTGIHVKVRSGESPEIATEIVREGKHTPADVFFSENSPELQRLQKKGLLAPVAPSTLKQIPSRYSSAKGLWIGVLARQDVLTYNPRMIKKSSLPKSLLALAEPRYKGKVAIAPTDSDFYPLVGAVLATYGRSRTLQWLRGLKHNAQLYQDDEGAAAAVEKGAVAMGIVNNYYYYRLREELGQKRMASKLGHFRKDDTGNLVNISGAAVLKYAPHPKLAQKFLAFMVSKKTQTLLAQSTIDFEYPLRPGVAANSQLEPFDQLQPPKISVEQLGDNREALKLLQEAGLL